MPKDVKETLPYSDMLARVRRVLASHPVACRNVRIDNLEVYRQHVEGANWKAEWFTCSGDDHDLVECRATIRADLEALRSAYDVGPT